MARGRRAQSQAVREDKRSPPTFLAIWKSGKQVAAEKNSLRMRIASREAYVWGPKIRIITDSKQGKTGVSHADGPVGPDIHKNGEANP